MDPEVYDITIVGAGPTGLFAAFYAGLRELRTKVVEALPEAGGQLAVLYPEKYIYDVPGLPKVLAKDLVRNLVEQTQMFEPELVLDERVETLTRATVNDDEVWRIGSAITAHFSKTIVITAGIGAFSPNRLDRPGVAEHEGNGVYYFFKDKGPLRGKRLLIVGGGDSAVDWCLNLKDWAAHITLIHRRDQFRAHESSVVELKTSGIPILIPYELKRVIGDEEGVKGAIIYDNTTGVEKEIPVEAVLINIGYKAALGPLGTWGMEMADDRHIKVDGFMETSLPGVYAAGDIAHVDGSEPLNLIVTGFAQAAIAANAAKTRIDPASRMFPGHSSEKRL